MNAMEMEMEMEMKLSKSLQENADQTVLESCPKLSKRNGTKQGGHCLTILLMC